MNFYKAVLTFCFLFSLGTNSFGQFQTSFWGGINQSSFGGSPPDDASYGPIYGLSFGANFDFQPTGDFIISLEPSFEQKGSKIDVSLEEGLKDTTLTYKISQDYFGLGLLFKVNSGNFYVGSGISLQVLSSAKLEFENNETDIKDKFLDYDALAFFNVGYKIPIGGPALFFELRYIQGLFNIQADENESDSVDYFSNIKSTGLRLSTGILIPF